MDLPTQEVEVDRNTRSLTCYCEQGHCKARLKITLARPTPQDFSCPHLLGNKFSRFYCKEPDIRGGKRVVSLCYAYLDLRTRLEERRHKKFPHFQGFTGTYAAHLMPEGIDPL